MKKIVAFIITLVMVLSLAACGSTAKTETKTEANDRLAKIKEAGVMTVATEPYFAPYEFVDPNKEGQEQYVGYDMEIAKYIADKIGVELEIVPLEFSAVQAGTADGKYDMAISAMAYSPERAETFTTSNGYRSSGEGYGFCCRLEDLDKYTTIESVKDAVCITQSGSVEEALFRDYVAEFKDLKLVASMTDAYIAVAENKADVAIVSKSSAQLYADANGGLGVPDFTFDDPNGYNSVRVYMPKKDCESLCELVNQCIDELTADGSLDKWYKEAEEYAKTLGV